MGVISLPANLSGSEDLEHLTDNLQTVGDLVRWGASCLKAAGLHFGHGTDNAADESRVLVFHALSLDFQVPEYFYDSRVTSQERNAVIKLIERRIDEGRPAAYLTGEAWFAGMRFEVTPHVLVPRSPIAEMILNGFEPWCRTENIKTVLDLGTGSGCIAIAIAAHMGAEVDAVDISPPAVRAAHRNVKLHGLEDLVHVSESDLYRSLPDKKYDLIVSNPPYVSATSMQRLPDEYKHEPEIALAADEDGLSVIHRILRRAADYLQPAGVLVVEAGEAAGALVASYPDVPFDWVEFEHGGDGVFVLSSVDLARSRDLIAARCA